SCGSGQRYFPCTDAAPISPIRERRATFIQDKGMLLELLRQGSERVHHLTQQTLHEVKRGLGLPVLF
ncbi:hypothetical protein ACV1F1_00015, partial [Klebsiella pneumoniae]